MSNFQCMQLHEDEASVETFLQGTIICGGGCEHIQLPRRSLVDKGFSKVPISYQHKAQGPEWLWRQANALLGVWAMDDWIRERSIAPAPAPTPPCPPTNEYACPWIGTHAPLSTKMLAKHLNSVVSRTRSSGSESFKNIFTFLLLLFP
jgi:hypothetical protein